MSPIQYFNRNGAPITTGEIENRQDITTVVIEGRFTRVEIDIGSETSYCHQCQLTTCYHVKRAEAILD